MHGLEKQLTPVPLSTTRVLDAFIMEECGTEQTSEFRRGWAVEFS